MAGLAPATQAPAALSMNVNETTRNLVETLKILIKVAMDRQLVPMLEQPAQLTRADWLRMRRAGFTWCSLFQVLNTCQRPGKQKFWMLNGDA